MATTPAPANLLAPKGYRVKLTDVKANVWGINKDNKAFVEEREYPVRPILSGWMFQFSGGLTWVNGLHKNLGIATKLESTTEDTLLLSDSEYATLKSVVERVPAMSQFECLIVAQVMAAEQVSLKAE